MAHSLLSAADSTLLIVDMQTRLAAAMDTPTRESTRAAVIRLARAADELALPVIVTRQYPRGLGDTDPDLAQALPAGAQTVDKTTFAAGDTLAFSEALRMTGRREIVICGMEAHVCVLQTAMQLAVADYRPFVVSDGVCSRRADHAADAVARLRAAGIAAGNHESVLFEWLRDANHPSFRALSALLKPSG